MSIWCVVQYYSAYLCVCVVPCTCQCAVVWCECAVPGLSYVHYRPQIIIILDVLATVNMIPSTTKST